MANAPAPHLHDWTFPDARAVVAIVHGYAEHGARYAHVAAGLREHGLAALAVDLRGHGRSAGRRGHIDDFASYHADVQALLAATQARCGELPRVLLAHSMGGLVALDLLASGASLAAPVAGVVLSSPFLGVANRIPWPKRWLARLLAQVWPSCRLPSGLDAERVCRDPEQRRFYTDDPLVFDTATPGWYRAALRAIARVHASALSPVNLPPLLLLVAGADHVVSADATRRFAREHRLEDAVVEYPDYFHELLNERPPERAIVIERIAAWIDGLLSERSPGSPEEDRRWGAPPTSG